MGSATIKILGVARQVAPNVGENGEARHMGDKRKEERAAANPCKTLSNIMHIIVTVSVDCLLLLLLLTSVYFKILLSPAYSPMIVYHTRNVKSLKVVKFLEKC